MKCYAAQIMLFFSLLLFSCQTYGQQHTDTLCKYKTAQQLLQNGLVLSRAGNVILAGGLGLCLGGFIWMTNAFEYQGNKAFTVVAAGGGIALVGLTIKIIGGSKVRKANMLLAYDTYQNPLNQSVGIMKIGIAIPLH